MNHVKTVQALRTANGQFRVTQKMSWVTKPTHYEFQIPLHNVFGEPLVLGGIMNRSRTHYGSVWVRNKMDSKFQVIRLCLRGIHKNKRPGDRQHWNPGSHLHCWDPVDFMKFAVDPESPPWPPVEWVENTFDPLAQDDYRLALATFCSMHGISLDFESIWTDIPVIEEPAYVVTPTGEEIP